MLTYVTAFYPTRTDVDRASYRTEFMKVVESGVPIFVFVDPTLPLPEIPSSVRVARRPLPVCLPPGLEIRLPSHRNERKDTVPFLSLMLQKLYFMTEVLQETDASHIAWIDFRIFHIIQHTQLAQTKLKALTTRSFPGLTKLLSSGCWDGPPFADLFESIHWRFCGGIVLGPRAAIEPAYRRQMELVAAHLPRLTWEVNYWAMMEEHFEWYKADHNDSLLMNLPYSPRIVRPGASTYYVDGGQSRQVHVGQAIEQALFAEFCAVSEDGVLVLPKTDMLVNSAEYTRMKQSVPWDDPAISEEGPRPAGTLLCLDTSRGISRRAVLHYPLDDGIFREGIRMDVPAWETRRPLVVWRGGTSGVERPTARQRVVAALLDSPHADVKFVRGGWPQNDAEIPEAHCGARLTRAEQCQYKYMLSVDGNGAASSIQWVFATGCVPLIVSHPETHFWLKEVLTPGVDYVAIAYDLSDLHSTLDWLVTHDAEAQQIAQNALRVSQTILSPAFQADYLRRKMQENRDI